MLWAWTKSEIGTIWAYHRADPAELASCLLLTFQTSDSEGSLLNIRHVAPSPMEDTKAFRKLPFVMVS